jgi:hypothetical protein
MSRCDIPVRVQRAESASGNPIQDAGESSGARFRALGAGTSQHEVLYQVCWPEKPKWIHYRTVVIRWFKKVRGCCGPECRAPMTVAARGRIS